MLPWLALALAGPLADRVAALDPDLPLVEALAARVAIDQEARLAFHHGLPEEEETRLVEEMAAIDAANLPFLLRLLEEGWVRQSIHGREAAHNAWLLAQHADATPELQREILARLHTLHETSDVAPKDLAYLHDRVAVNAGESQRYGTQGSCDETWTPAPLEDPAAVDTLRASVGLASLADYARGFDCNGRRAGAWEQYESGHHAGCASAFAELAAERGNPDDWYNAACCASMGGDVDGAFVHIEAAWSAGFDDLASAEEDTDLAAMRADPRWQTFVADHQPAVIVALDPRIELLHVLARLAGFEEFQSAPSGHATLVQIDAWFSKHSDHDAVRALRDLRRRRRLGYNAVSALGFVLDDADTPALRVARDPFPEGLDTRLDSHLVDAFPAVLSRFVVDADWAGWRAASAERRRDLETTARSAFDAEDPQSWFNDAFPDTTPGHLFVVPEIIAWENNYAGRADSDRYIVLGSMDWRADGGIANLGMLSILVHEMAHSYAGAHLDAGAEELLSRSSERLFKRVHRQMRQQAYGRPGIMLDESITRALTQLYLRERHPDEVAADDGFNDSQSFYWTSELADAIAPHRSEQGVIDLNAADADMAAVLDRWAKAPKEAFRPKRLLVESVTSGPSVIVRPLSLAQHLDPLIQRFWGDVEVRTPEQGPGYNGPIVVYGSPADSPLVAALLTARGLTLDQTGLRVSDTVTVEGDNVRIIFAVEHEGREWVVYSAFDPAQIQGIHGLMHGPFSLTVGRGDEVVLQR